jgi:hypothetical protein
MIGKTMLFVKSLLVGILVGTLYLLYCPDCELTFLSPLPSAEVFERLYIHSRQFGDKTYKGVRAWLLQVHYWRTMRRLVRRISWRGNKLRTLEIGSGLSWMSRAVKFSHPHAITVAQDISSEAASRCRWVDHFIVGDLIGKLDEIGRHAPFNIISMTHVIEHLPDPTGTLRICAKLLDSTGILFVTAPHRPSGWQISTPIAVWEKWGLNQVPAHLQYFSEKSLNQCAQGAGLSLLGFDVGKSRGEAFEAWLSHP